MKTQGLTEAQVLDQVKLTKSKLGSMKDHLEALLSKKIRIETEIILLRKAIKNQEKSLSLKLKNSVQLESLKGHLSVDDHNSDEIMISYDEEVPEELRQLIAEVCSVSQDIEQVLENFERTRDLSY